MKIKNYYEAPDIKVLELCPQQIICGSTGEINNMGIDSNEITDENF